MEAWGLGPGEKAGGLMLDAGALVDGGLGPWRRLVAVGCGLWAGSWKESDDSRPAPSGGGRW